MDEIFIPIKPSDDHLRPARDTVGGILHGGDNYTLIFTAYFPVDEQALRQYLDETIEKLKATIDG